MAFRIHDSVIRGNIAILCLLCVPLLSCSQSHESSKVENLSNTNPIALVASKRKLSDLDPNTIYTEEQVTNIWGLPDDYAGSGGTNWLYYVGDRVVWLTFGSTPPHHLTSLGCINPSKKVAHVVGRRKLSDITFTKGITYEEITAIWGWPDSFAGFGIDYYVYHLEDGKEVLIYYDVNPPYHVLGANLIDPKIDQIKHLL